MIALLMNFYHYSGNSVSTRGARLKMTKCNKIRLLSGIIFALSIASESSLAKSKFEIRKELKAAVADKTYAFGNGKNRIHYYFARSGTMIFYTSDGKVKRSYWTVDSPSGKQEICYTLPFDRERIRYCGPKSLFNNS